MVISHKYKYLFIEFPLTGSTSVSKALVEDYDGERILFKHASYFDYKKSILSKENDYFIFSCIRNPLDQAVSHYYKYKTDHRGRYTRLAEKYDYRYLVNRYQVKRFKFVANSPGFEEYFLKFYKWPYNSWSSISHPHCDYVMRFENLSSSYCEALKRIGIKNPLPLPSANTTKKQDSDFISCYSSKAIIRAKKVFGIYMKELGYEFPKEWGEVEISTKERMLYKLQNAYKHIYWKHLRYYALKLEKLSIKN